MRTSLLSLAAIVMVAVLPACKSKTTADGTASAPPAGDAAQPSAVPDDGKDPGKSTVSIDPRIVALCGISEPNFPFDSATLTRQAKGVLDALTTCFVSGPAAGKNLRLVGHTDPRGDEEYNFGLGQRRADSVGNYLKKKGLGADRVETSSRGKLDATGTDEAGWAQDRKAEILLAE